MSETSQPSLRDQIAASVREKIRIRLGPNAAGIVPAGSTVTLSGGEADDIADLALAVVQPELDAKDARIAELDRLWRESCEEVHYLNEEIIYRERMLHEQTIARAKTAEAEVARLKAENDRLANRVENERSAGESTSRGLLEKLQEAEDERDQLREQQTGLIGQIGRSEIAAAQARQAIERVRAWLQGTESHPTHDHLCPDDVLKVLDQAPATSQPITLKPRMADDERDRWTRALTEAVAERDRLREAARIYLLRDQRARLRLVPSAKHELAEAREQLLAALDQDGSE